MRYFITSLAALAIAACATPPDAPQKNTGDAASRPSDQLAARQLADGECALFVWTAGVNPRFTVFIPMDDDIASVYHDGAERRAVLTTPLFDPDPGTAPGFGFTLEDGTPGTLSLQGYEAIEGGVRYARGTLKTGGENDTQTVRPVAGVATCLENYKV